LVFVMRVALSGTPGRVASRPSTILSAVGIIVVFLLFLAHRSVVALPATATSPLVPFARLFDIVLVCGALLLAHAAGARALRAFGLVSAPAEGAAFATGLGLGLGAYCALALAFVGLYRAPILLGGLAVATVVLRGDLIRSVTGLASWGGRIARSGSSTVWGAPAVVILLGFAGFVALLGALTPPHHWDPLSYHLVAPQQFLRTGRIVPVPGVEFSNLPLTTELLYGVGLAAGSEAFGQLLHAAYALICGLGVWGMAQRHRDRTTAWLALPLFFGAPLVFVWARVANNDLTLGCFVLLSIAAALRANPGPEAADSSSPAQARRWLALAGIFAGLAFGTKYQAVYAIAPLGVVLLVDHWATQARATGRPWRAVGTALLHAAIFGVLTALVASPWYIKNWLWLGNPVWPTVFGGKDFSPLASDITREFLSDRVLSPRTPLGYALLPLRAYLTGSYEQPHVILHPLYLLCPVLVLLWRQWRRDLWYALILSIGFLAAFTEGVQELRYLLVICPLLSLLTAIVLRAAWDRVALRRPVMGSLIVSALVTILLVGLHVGADRPIAVLLGQESRDAYLGQNVAYGASHRALSYLAAQLQPGERALFMDEAQVFYLPPDLVASGAIHPDHLNLQLLLLTEVYPEPSAMLGALQREGIDYLLLNEANIRSWQKSDPNGRARRGKEALDQLTPLLEPVYQNGNPERPHIVIYRVPPAAR
jgi:hypothetical protein